MATIDLATIGVTEANELLRRYGDAGRGRRGRQPRCAPPHRRRPHRADRPARARLGRLLLRRAHRRARGSRSTATSAGVSPTTCSTAPSSCGATPARSPGVAIRGADVVVHGNLGSRAGQVMKAGTLCCGGNASFMAGYMMYGGRLVICGDSGEQVGQDMTGGTIYVGGKVRLARHRRCARRPASPGRRTTSSRSSTATGSRSAGSCKKIVNAGKNLRYSRTEPRVRAIPFFVGRRPHRLLEREGAGGHPRQGADRPLPDPRLRRRAAAAAPERPRVPARPRLGRARPGRRLEGRARDLARRALRRDPDRAVDARDDRADELRGALEVDQDRARQGLDALRHLRQLGRGRPDPGGARGGQARRRAVPRRAARLERARDAPGRRRRDLHLAGREAGARRPADGRRR